MASSLSSSSSSFPVKFIEKSLLATDPFTLSYTDPDQKWLIRKHLTSFLQELPNFKLSTDTFNHNNGTTVQLFRLEGSLRTQQQLPSVELTIWVHENYPLTPPLVFVNPNSIPIRTNHTFINSSGHTNSNYIDTWEYPRCNLLDFIRNLQKVLSNDHPFVHQTGSIPTRNQSVSRTEAIDRLATSLHYDAITIMERSGKEIQNLWKLQSELKNRSESIRTIITDLETEKETLKERALKLKDDTHVLAIWVETNYQRLMKSRSVDMEIEEMFEMECDDEDDDAKKLVVESIENTPKTPNEPEGSDLKAKSKTSNEPEGSDLKGKAKTPNEPEGSSSLQMSLKEKQRAVRTEEGSRKLAPLPAHSTEGRVKVFNRFKILSEDRSHDFDKCLS